MVAKKKSSTTKPPPRVNANDLNPDKEPGVNTTVSDPTVIPPNDKPTPEKPKRTRRPRKPKVVEPEYDMDINLIKPLPAAVFSVIARARGYDVWKLTESEKTEIAVAIKPLVDAYGHIIAKYFPFLTAGMVITSIVVDKADQESKAIAEERRLLKEKTESNIIA